MKNFRIETPVLTEWGDSHIYETNDGEIFFSDYMFLPLYELGEELPERVSLVISSRPTKQAVPFQIKRYVDIYCDGADFEMKEKENKRCRYSRVFSGFRRFLENQEPFKSMKRRETLLVYVTLYIHSK